jgi:hypothetical protein
MLTDFYAPTLASDVKAISDQFAIVSRAVGETMLQKQHTDEWRSKMAETAALASAELTNLVQSAQKNWPILPDPSLQANNSFKPNPLRGSA